jgi:saccharopine dehydrogenase-like NADP-dependent oxidoreductase
VTGTGTDGNTREVYLYHVVDNEETWGRDGAQAVVWQTAINPVIALELLANGTWAGTGVLGPEAFPADPFLELLTAYGSPWGIEERPPRLMTRR